MRIMPFWLLLFVCLVPSSFAAEAASRDSIRQLQAILSQRLYDGRIDGLNGPKTERAILFYEQQHSLPTTGQASAGLLEHLRNEQHISKANADNDINAKIDTLSRDLNHTQSHLNRMSFSVEAVKKSISGHFIKTFYELTILFTTVIGIITAVGVFLIDKMFVKKYEAAEAGLKAAIARDHKIMLDEVQALVYYQVYTRLSHACYRYYRNSLNNTSDDGFKNAASLATFFSEGAVENAKKLPNNNVEKEDLLIFAESHKAYHVASNRSLSVKDTKNAIEAVPKFIDLADRMLKAGKFDQWIYCRDTVAWIYQRLGNKEQQAEGLRIVNELLKDEDIPTSMRKEIEYNYQMALVDDSRHPGGEA